MLFVHIYNAVDCPVLNVTRPTAVLSCIEVNMCIAVQTDSTLHKMFYTAVKLRVCRQTILLNIIRICHNDAWSLRKITD